MYKLGYYIAKIKSKILRNHEILVQYYRKGGVNIGENCLICTPCLGVDAWLITIGDNTIVSTDVEFVTHDYSISRVFPDKSNLYGRITIGNNCFVGARSVLMYGIDIPDNVIIAAGSVVVNSFTAQNIVIAGNPAKVIGTWDDLVHKYKDKATYAYNIKDVVSINEEVLVKRRCK